MPGNDAECLRAEKVDPARRRQYTRAQIAHAALAEMVFGPPNAGLSFKNKVIEAMANTKSAKKAVRKIARRTDVNGARRSRMRTYVRKVEEAIDAGDKKAAEEAFKLAQPEVMRAAQKRILHKNTASRRLSRLSARVKALGS